MVKRQLEIIKIGGKLINDNEHMHLFLEQVAAIQGDVIIVHGGGRKATELSALLGIPTQMIDGRRITDMETLEVAVMVYAGIINKQIVAFLQRLGVDAIGLSGADGNLIQAHKREVQSIDYGYVGDIDYINEELIQRLLDMGLVPTVCAISHDRDGQLLNTNADTIAAQLAITMSTRYQVSLKFCFEYPGVLYDISQPQHTMSTIQETELQDLQSSGAIHTGMLPKLVNGMRALHGGVSQVTICGIDNLHTLVGATQLSIG